ncbi:MAG: HAMP domain-containing protein [Deltaproteobacteria bacterium]|nr:MAG: HAMP domain-containing protein [Deltaproteobacteria bacterium]
MRFFSQLSVRLFLILTGLLVVAFTAYVATNYDLHRQHLEIRTTDYAATTSDIIVRSARHAMMQNARAEIAEMIGAIGEQKQVDAARIYNKAGAIVFSTDPAEVGRTVDVEADACAACHTSGTLREVVPTEQLARRFRGKDGHRIIGFIRPIENEPGCSTAACHEHPASQRVLGVLDLQLSLAQTDADLARAGWEMGLDAVLVTLFAALAAWLFIMLMVRRPVRRLTEGARRIGRLEPAVTLDVRAAGELGELSRTFNTMARQLDQAREENAQWSASLEAKVEAKAAELQRAQAHLVHTEKLASIGKLSAVIAHEINNPLSSVLTYARLVSRRLGNLDRPLSDEDRARLREHLSTIESETRRCGETVKNLLIFSKRKADGLCPTHVVEVVERALRLVRHRLEISGIEIHESLRVSDDLVVCNVDQLQQVLVALLVNAAEAMEGGGRLAVELVEPDPAHLDLIVRDSGPGIPEDILPHIFEPFFTTKSETSGVGLGLAVVHGIVESHGGRTTVETSPDGTTFRVTLPRSGPEIDADEEEDPRRIAGIGDAKP